MKKVLGMTIALGMVVSAAQAQVATSTAAANANKTVSALKVNVTKMSAPAKAGFQKYFSTSSMATLKSSLTLAQANSALVNSVSAQLSTAKDAQAGARLGAVLAAVAVQESAILSDAKNPNSAALKALATGNKLTTGWDAKSHDKFVKTMAAVVNASKDDAKSSADVEADIAKGFKTAGVNAAEVASNCGKQTAGFNR